MEILPKNYKTNKPHGYSMIMNTGAPYLSAGRTSRMTDPIAWPGLTGFI